MASLFSFILSLLLLLNPAKVDLNLTSESQDFLNLGIKAIQTENYPQAKIYFDQAIASPNNSSSAYSYRCLVFIHLQNYSQAQQDCTQSLQLSPHNQLAYLHRGLASYRLGDYQRAIGDYQQLLTLNPNNLQAYYNRALSYSALGKYEKAIADYNQALVNISTPDSLLLENIYNDRGLAYGGMKNFPKAMVDFERVIRLNPDYSWGYYNLACVCHQHGEYRKAINGFTEALQHDPYQGEAYLNRGLVLVELGYYEAGIKDIQQGAKCFSQQNKILAYEQALNLIKKLQHNLSFSEGLVG